jgi:cytochrome b561
VKAAAPSPEFLPKEVFMNPLPTRHHPALVVLHWLLAALLLLALAMGTFVLKEMPNASPDKIGALRGHMVVGIAIGALMLVRLLVRWRSRSPAAALTGNQVLDRLGKVAHMGLYLLVFAMAASGMATALQAGLPEIIFGGSGTPLPESFAAYPARWVHGAVATLLLILIGVHVAGAGYHQVVLKDRLLSRMGFGKRQAH